MEDLCSLTRIFLYDIVFDSNACSLWSQCVHWNEDIGEWQLKCVAYTGNNMRKQTPAPDKERDKVCELFTDALFIYRQ